MIDHLGIRVSDYQRSKQFYVQALAPLGYALLFEHPISGAGFGRDGQPAVALAIVEADLTGRLGGGVGRWRRQIRGRIPRSPGGPTAASDPTHATATTAPSEIPRDADRVSPRHRSVFPPT